MRFASGGALWHGVDLAESAIGLARRNFQIHGLTADLRVANGEELPFADDLFDLVYAHGVVQYKANDRRLVAECRRVLKPGGEAVFQVYNRRSWLNALSKLMKVPLEHEDAPVLKRYTAAEFRSLLDGFSQVELVYERFPVKSRLHKVWKGAVYNAAFVGTFNALPRSVVRPSGGQRQRIAIARAFLKDPALLLLDEATSDLDAESEFLVQRALADLTRGRTVLVIAHRLATVRNADRVVVIDGGRIAEVGPHDELIARENGIYRRLATLQMLDAPIAR